MATSPLPQHLADRIADFAGREWVLEKVAEWLNDPHAPQMLLITGEPGCGKTTLAAWLTAPSHTSAPNVLNGIRNAWTAQHFCMAEERRGSVQPARFAQSLAQQISDRLPEFGPLVLEFVAPTVRGEARAEVNWGTVIGTQIQKLLITSPDPEEVYDRSVRQPLERLCERKTDARIFMLVDALDEALTMSRQCTIVGLLAGSADFPPNVRFFLTSRPEPKVLEKFPRARLLNLSDPAFRSEVDADIRAYIAQHGVPGLSPGHMEALVAAAEGNFLYVHWLLDEVARGVRKIGDLTTLPVGLHALYHGSLSRLVQNAGPNAWPERFQPLLGRLSVAASEVPFELLGKWTNQQPELAANLSRVYQFVESSVDGLSYRLYHRSMADFLALQVYDSNGVKHPNFYDTPPRLQHQAIADFYLGRFGNNWEACDGYGLRHLALHLKQAEKSDELRQLLLTFRWLQAKVDATGLAGLIADYDYLAADKDLRLIQAALRLSAHILAQDPGQLRSQLFGRLLSTSSPEILGMLDGARSAARQPWLRPLTASLAAERSIRWLRPARPEPLSEVAFSTNGLWAAHISRPFGPVSSDVVLWDLKDWQSCGPRFQTLARGAPFALALSDDARWCLYADSVGGVYRSGALSDEVWEGHAHHELAIANLLAISADGRRALSACTRGRLVAWDIEAGRHEVIWDDSNNRITALSLDAEGESAVVARADGSVDLLDLWPARPRTLFKLNGRPSALARSSNNSLVAAATMDGRIELHSVHSPEPPIAIFCTQGQPTTVAMSSDRRYLAVGSDGGTVEVWSIARGARSAVYHRAHTYEVKRIVFSHDDAHVISADSLHIKEWAPEAAGQEERGSIGARAAGQVTATAEGLHAVAVLEDGRLGIWNIRTGALESILPHASGPVFGDPSIGPPKGIVLAAKAPRILSWNERLLCVWDLRVGASVGSLSVADTRGAAVTPDGTGVVYINGRDITLWRPDEGESSVLGTYRDGRPDYVVISPDGRRVLSSGEDGRVIVWRLNGLPNAPHDRMLDSYWPDARDKPSIVAFAGHEEVVITTRDGSLFVLDMRKRKAQPEPKRFEGRHAGWVDRVLVNRDSRLFVTSSSSDQTVQVWDLDARRSIAVLDDHPGCIEQLSRSAERVLLHTYDGVLKIVSLRDGVLLNVFQGDKQIVSCAADAELEWVVARDEGGQMHFLHVEPGASAIGTKVDTVTGSSG